MERVLSLSYGKDSLACLGAIERLGLPLDRIVHAEVWATDDIPADLPPMVEFKAKADALIKERWGIEVEHFYAVRNGRKDTFERYFYDMNTKGKHKGTIHGFPLVKGCAIQSRMKMAAINRIHSAVGEHIQYVGIASDEVENRTKLDGVTKISPLLLADMTQADNTRWCKENDLYAPIYTMGWKRDGCFYCPAQGVDSLRLLRNNYPELWGFMLRLDSDNPPHAHFKPDGHTVHDYDARFKLEDAGVINPAQRFLWSMLEKES